MNLSNLIYLLSLLKCFVLIYLVTFSGAGFKI